MLRRRIQTVGIWIIVNRVKLFCSSANIIETGPMSSCKRVAMCMQSRFKALKSTPYYIILSSYLLQHFWRLVNACQRGKRSPPVIPMRVQMDSATHHHGSYSLRILGLRMSNQPLKVKTRACCLSFHLTYAQAYWVLYVSKINCDRVSFHKLLPRLRFQKSKTSAKFYSCRQVVRNRRFCSLCAFL